jgi:DNA-binding response OmpR family regulator
MLRLLIAKSRPSRAACGRFFGRCGYEVTTATSSADCLTELIHFAPHVLVLDLQLPGGAGTVLGWLHKAWASLPVPAVVLIGEDSPQSVTRTILTSPVVAAYLQRPFPRRDLLEVVRCATAAVWRRTPWDQAANRPCVCGAVQQAVRGRTGCSEARDRLSHADGPPGAAQEKNT